ncbi:MAG: cation:proton antiporter [Candidatus Gracilibacteria bacterium]|nr:cation:proton antiporter [Candidatus Gracilibacteria bacterium]
MGASTLAHSMGFSYSLGAFIAGMLIAETNYKHQVEADLIPFRDLLLGFFFVTVGIQLNLEVIYNNIEFIFIILSVLLLVKIAIIFLVLVWSNNKKISLKTAFTLFQFGEFGIVIFDLATSKNLLDPNISQILIVVIIISMISTPVILKNVDNIVDFIFGKKVLDYKDCLDTTKLKNHIVLIGYGRLGKVISNLLDKNNIKYIIIENYIKAYKEGQKDGKPIIFGNSFQENFLKSINIEDAKTILISVGKNEKLYLIVSVIKRMNISGNITIKVNNFEEKDMIEKLKVKNIIVETEKTALAMTEKLIKHLSKGE